MSRLTLFLLLNILFLAPQAGAAEARLVTVAVLKFGTVNWELDVIRRHGLDKKHGFKLRTVELISNNAVAVSLQGGASDIIVTDWLWVARQQRSGRHYNYYPFSNAVGEILVPESFPAQTLVDLKGKTLGVAGGPEGKTWLLFRAYSRKLGNADLADQVDERFAAPPLLNALADTGQLDAVMTYWHYGAVLKAQGYRSLLSLESVLKGLDIGEKVPLLGWVFARQWGLANPNLVNRFLAASYEAKSLLMNSELEWEALRPKMHQGHLTDALFQELKTGYRRGVPSGFSPDDFAAITGVSRILNEKTEEQTALFSDAIA